MAPDFLHEVVPYLQGALVGRLRRNVPLSGCSRWRIGGAAAILIDCASIDDVVLVKKTMVGRSEPVFVMGDASNMLFDNAGFNGIVLRIARGMAKVQVDGNSITAEAGVWIPQLARRAASVGLSGLEHTSGIPGTLGGLVAMNGGSQRKGIGLNISAVHCVDGAGNRITLSKDACQFGYRQSVFQDNDLTIVAAELILRERPRQTVVRDMLDILSSRKKRFPKSLPNGGSTFVSNPALYETLGPPGRIIEQLGLKGVTRGGAQISPMHANFIVNLGGASSHDVLWLIHLIREETFKKTGIWMECEVRHLSPDGELRPAHEAALERIRAIS